MDRELEIINSIKTLADLVEGLQKMTGSLTECLDQLRVRVEALENKCNLLG